MRESRYSMVASSLLRNTKLSRSTANSDVNFTGSYHMPEACKTVLGAVLGLYN